ncbi:MAG: hypothetical protein QXH37_05385 [Candidatus Bathyarchaeia archaeon]
MNLHKNMKIGIVAKFLGISRFKRFVQRDTKLPNLPTETLEITVDSVFPYEISEMCREHQRQAECQKAQALIYCQNNRRIN